MSATAQVHAARIAHLHTYFFFPFTVNSKRVAAENAGHFGSSYWLDGFESWVQTCDSGHSADVRTSLGCWERASYKEFDMDSPAYADMVFFHPFVRHVFFDTQIGDKVATNLSLIRCYRIPIDNQQVYLKAVNERGQPEQVQVTDLRLFVFANGIGILSIGVEARDLALEDALWVNEMLRKVYPSSGRQRREGRAPSSVALTVVREGHEVVVAEEDFSRATMVGFEPPLSALVRKLLYFLDYYRQEYEQVLDERMIVYTYAEVDPASVPEDFLHWKEYEQVLSRFLYVDRAGDGYRYDEEFIRNEMKRQVYRRWAHEGTFYGYTSYSCVTLCLGTGDRGGHKAREGFLIHRMFNTRYYLMTIVALFYRATLLAFNEKTALVSKLLYQDQLADELKRGTIEQAQDLRAEYLHFTNYWYFEELSNKDEESEHFYMQCREMRLDETKEEVARELEGMSAQVNDYYQSRNTAAVNRLAMLSLMFGAGAVFTGFFGMNFGRGFGEIFFEPSGDRTWAHDVAIAGVTIFTLGALAFGLYLIVANWSDYRFILNPRGRKDDKS